VTGHIKYLRSSGLLDFFGLFGLLKVRKGLEKELGVFLMPKIGQIVSGGALLFSR
jgi:hypothetical protein